MDSYRRASVGLELGVERGSISQTHRQRYRHRCLLKSRKAQRLTMLDVILATAIVLSVLIMLVEAIFIGNANMRRFSNLTQAALACVFLLEFGYRAWTSTDASYTDFFFLGKDAPWNICDAILNILGILDIIIDSWEGRFVHGVATARMFRIFGLFRIFASNKFLKDIGTVLHTAMIQMVNFSLVVTITLTIFSVWATNMLYDFPDEEIAECYQSLGASFWTLFKMLTMDGWIAHADQVLAIHPSLLYFYGVFVFLCISSLSIVPAIFIEISIQDREKARKRKAQLKLQRRRKSPIAAGLNARVFEGIRDDANISESDSDTSCWSGSQPSLPTSPQNAQNSSGEIYSPDLPARRDPAMMLRGTAQGHASLPRSQSALSMAHLDPLVSGQGQDVAATDFQRGSSTAEAGCDTITHEMLRLKHDLQSMLLAVTDDILTQLVASNSKCSRQRKRSYTKTMKSQKDCGHSPMLSPRDKARQLGERPMERSPSLSSSHEANVHSMANSKIDNGLASCHDNVSASGAKDASCTSLSYPLAAWNLKKMSANRPQV